MIFLSRSEEKLHLLIAEIWTAIASDLHLFAHPTHTVAANVRELF